MDIREFLAPEAVTVSPRTASKKQLFQDLAARAQEAYGLDPRLLFDLLLERERLGATALGRGVAAPHARIEGLDRIRGVFIRLEKPIEFDALDGEKVDLVFALFAPEEAGADHLRALAKVSRALRDPAVCAKLRSAKDGAALYAVLTESLTSRAA